MDRLTRKRFHSMKYEDQIKSLQQTVETSDEESDDDLESQNSDDEWIPPKTFKKVAAGSSKSNRNCKEFSDIEDVFDDENLTVEWGSDGNDSESDTENCVVSEAENVPIKEVANESESAIHGKDGTRWSLNPTEKTQDSNQTIEVVHKNSGPVASTKNLSIRETFDCIFNLEMRNIIVEETNRKANEVFALENAKNPPDKPPRVWKNVNVQELDAYLAILITAGVHHSNKEHLTELWKTYSNPLYRAAMGRNRFQAISRFIRFDDFNTRQERQKTDKAAPISKIFEIMNENLIAFYEATAFITIDEQLFAYRGRTKFTQYMPKKPAKYGIKVWWACDGSTSYPLLGQIYTGQPSTGREKNQGERVVKDLCLNYKNTGKNITADNFFTTHKLAEFLLTWDFTFVGTMKHNKTCIPKEMLKNNSREPLSTLFGFNKNATICSYVPKKNKSVILLSTLHQTKEISNDLQKKPEIIKFYNRTKGGVDNMDKMAAAFSVKRKTLRWPVAFFYNIIDVSGVAAFILYKSNNPQFGKKTDARRTFLKQLGIQLAMPMIIERSKTPTIYRNFSTKMAIEAMLGCPIVSSSLEGNSTVDNPITSMRDASGRLKIVGNCYKCLVALEKRTRKTRKQCSVCNRPICSPHTITISQCIDCAHLKNVKNTVQKHNKKI